MDTVTLGAYKHLEQLPNIGRGIRRGIYRHCAEPVIVDNSWAWHMNDAIDSTRDIPGEETKVICTVDDIADCLAPFILLIGSNPESVSHIYARANVIRAQAGISRKADRGYAGSFEVVDRGVFDIDAR